MAAAIHSTPPPGCRPLHSARVARPQSLSLAGGVLFRRRHLPRRNAAVARRAAHRARRRRPRHRRRGVETPRLSHRAVVFRPCSAADDRALSPRHAAARAISRDPRQDALRRPILPRAVPLPHHVQMGLAPPHPPPPPAPPSPRPPPPPP